ncbi:hemolysin family protein [Flavobacterium antarcticum]|uniref:hemolysin family protein n=1 Tax=Flavobacterium antarcticum TaxID=271155 RepID=UPI0003B68F72|nr:hemolysin family protein [Flavobacterium antarcticum]
MEAFSIVCCLILSAFFSGVEIAYISSNKVYLGIEKMQDTFVSRILFKLTKNPSKFIAAMLIGNNIALVIYGILMSNLVLDFLITQGFSGPLWLILLIQIAITSAIIILTSEFLPKIFFQIYANTLIKILAVPAYFFYQIFYYFSSSIIWASNIILKFFFGIKDSDEQLLFSKIELGNYITEQMKSIENQEAVDSEIQIFQNALEFSGVKARDIMNPRTEIAAVEVHDKLIELRQLFVDTGYSKILVYQNSLDDIIGYVHSFDLFKKPNSIKSIMIPVEFVPETIFVKEVLNILTRKRKSVAIVLDEFGGTSGMITVEDIVEELFGEIEDEHDLMVESFIEEELSEGVYRFSARLDVEYINENYKLNIPECDSYSTLSGFIVHHTNEIPQIGTTVQIENFKFEIQQASNKKIELVQITITE